MALEVGMCDKKEEQRMKELRRFNRQVSLERAGHVLHLGALET